jgi:hypothetical protein
MVGPEFWPADPVYVIVTGRLEDDRFLAELFRGTEGQIYVCALRNNKSKLQSGEVAHVITRKIDEVKGFRDKWDRPEHECGIYFHTATLKHDAARRITQNCYHFISLFSDVDDANHELSRDVARALLEQAEYPPTLIVDSGHGLQAYWLLTEPCTDADRIEKARKAIQNITASDNVADAARVMRLVGSHNSKRGNGEWLNVEIVSHNPECRYRLEDLEHWLEHAPVIIRRKPEEKPEEKPKQKHNGGAFYDDVPDLAAVRDALRHVPNDDREDWRNIGMALNDAFGDAGREVWTEWSASSAKYDAGDQEKTWRSFTPGGGIGIGTLFHHAKHNGWQSPRKARRNDGKTKTEKAADAEAVDDNELPPEAEDAIALAFADRHAHELRYVNAWGRWLSFDGSRWADDTTLHTFDRVRAICREIAFVGDKPARAVASAKTVVAVERLARADRRFAAIAEQWDDSGWKLNDKADDNGNL